MTAIFDCSLSVHPVLQVTASLVCIETVNKDCVLPSVSLKPVVTQVSQQTKSCTNSLITHYSLPVPPTLTQTFSDDTGQYYCILENILLLNFCVKGNSRNFTKNNFTFESFPKLKFLALHEL